MSDYQVMPDLSAEEYEALKADIGAHGIRVPVDVDEDGRLLDGHHRAAIAAELGIELPTRTVAGLSDEDKRHHAVAVNAHRRMLTREQRRELVRNELDRDPSRSDRSIGRICGVDHKTVGAMRRGGWGIPQPDSDDPRAILDRYVGIPYGHTEPISLMRKLGKVAAAYGETLDEQTLSWMVFKVRETEARMNAARRYLREGVGEMPPEWWRPVAADDPERLRAERNRLGEWDVDVKREAGKFLNFCKDAGVVITDSGGFEFPELLRYPVDEDRPPLPPEWTAEDEDKAAFGAICFWFYTPEELQQLVPANGGRS